MLKNDFIGLLSKYSYANRSLLYQNLLSFLISKFLNFKNDFDFHLEGDEKYINICIDNNGLFLFIDLDEDSMSIRYNQSEFYIFINEIALDELKMLLENFFEGKYLIKSFVDKDLIVKQELLFTNQCLKKYNQVDIYSNKDSTTIFEKEGYNWIRSFT
ncbi:hypothetical protein KYG33_21730 [Chryseobacterium sp. D764]|uniref:hypothetical protein n=1 Tax=Chryseobacterium sp. D764 TaxID=2856522 RepID=UPI001C5A13A6|nr:hypothetical protein [Chryseobacterium sp. D764]QXU49336.1 hypothetical protein KYG33_21730 [Chryseobacterium sp. D764]